ncbi:serine hydrolase domain-containing protein [Dyella solisilvae]|nr:serine hydrolase domain-containing protein [Dyella solisilvae]
MRRFALLLSLTMLPLAQAGATNLDTATAGRIDADVNTVLARTGTPGAVVAVYRKGELLYRHAYGVRDREARLPATPDTWFEIGSITKQFTAAAILQLQEAGKLSIDAPLATYLPDAPHAGEVTLRQLLSHTSGLPEYLDGPDAEAFAIKPQTPAAVLARVAGKPLDFKPGSRWSYSNTGYFLLGRVIEVVSGQTYDQYIREHLLEPAGMRHTYTMADEGRLSPMAVGYRHEGGQLQRAPAIHDSVGWSAGNLVSTIGDLQRWNDALAGGKIVRPAHVALMGTSVTTTEHGSADYGLGLFVDKVDGQPRIGHTGGSFGFTTANEYFPRQDLRIIAFTNNGDNPEPGEMLTRVIFDQLYPALAAAAKRPAAGADPAATASDKAAFAQIQNGKVDGARFGARLTAKLQAGLGKRLAGQLGPFGAPTDFIYKGTRHENGMTWRDYLIVFGPGSTLKFGFGVDADGKVASISMN